MTMIRKVQFLAVAAAAAFSGFAASPASAEEFSYSFNIGGFSDYRFRGFSQTDKGPAVQGGLDLGYGIGYAGVWASNVDFGPDANGHDIATAEVDFYAGIKPVMGPVTFDLGVIYYWYPKSKDTCCGGVPGATELDYVELKVGASGNLTNELSVGATFYWSPDYFGESGDTYVIEGTAAYSLPKMGIFEPSISGRIGFLDNTADVLFYGNPNDHNYVYWDAGLTLTVDKLAFDFRYIDTDVSNVGGFCDTAFAQCDATFVASVKVALP